MKNVWVAGSVNMDVVATAVRYPKIGETVPGTEVLFFPGGKGANQAVSAAKLGAPTALIGKIGNDAFGRDLREFLRSQNVDLTFLGSVSDTHTGTAVITVADLNNAIVVVPGANAFVAEADVTYPKFAQGDILVSQFEISISTVRAFFLRGQNDGATTILNPAPAIKFDHSLLELVDVLILNETELASIAGVDVHDDDPEEKIVEAASAVRRRPEQIVCVTLGRRGSATLIGNESVSTPGRPVKAVDTTGAGDCFVGAVAAQLAAGKPIRDAIGYANVAASICVQRMGAGPSMPTKAEVESKVKSELQ